MRLPLLQALKQALEGADFREFADRVSVLQTAPAVCSVRHVSEPQALQTLSCCCHCSAVTKHACEHMCRQRLGGAHGHQVADSLTLHGCCCCFAGQMLSVMKPKDYPRVP